VAYKDIYYDNEDWFEFELYELAANSDQNKLVPCHEFTYNGNTHLLHEVINSVMKNRSAVVALKL